MKLNWNWGTKLVISMGLFMLMIIGFVYLSFLQDFDLVEKDYYPKSLGYQVEIDKKINARQAGEPIKIENKNDNLFLTFPAGFNPDEVKGEMYLYRPSDKRQDHVFLIALDSNRNQYLSIASIEKGKYILKIDYEVSGKLYFQEETVFVKMEN